MPAARKASKKREKDREIYRGGIASEEWSWKGTKKNSRKQQRAARKDEKQSLPHACTRTQSRILPTA